MDPITIAMGLSRFVPKVVGWLGGSRAESVAEKVVNVAMDVTGKGTGAEALETLKGSPELISQYRNAVLAQEVGFQRMAVENASQINETMRAETRAEHWPAYSWRPFVGFCFGVLAVIAGLTGAAAYIGVLFADVDPEVLAHLPGMIGSASLLMGAMAPVLGVASWFRGKQKLGGQPPAPAGA